MNFKNEIKQYRIDLAYFKCSICNRPTVLFNFIKSYVGLLICCTCSFALRCYVKKVNGNLSNCKDCSSYYKRHCYYVKSYIFNLGNEVNNENGVIK